MIKEAEKLNPWFTEDQTHHALSSWSKELTHEQLSKWTDSYHYVDSDKKSVGVVMAGNIPLVGLHDLISVLLSGHNIIIRPSSDDHVLIRMVAAILSSLDNGYSERIRWADGKLKDFHAIIATGSNNTSRYFEHYFSKVPNVIRKNRNGIAILTGEEGENELSALGKDIFQYFGLGCRNVSKIYIPEDYDIDKFFGGIYSFNKIIEHNKYANNFDYYRSVFLLNADKILENGFLLLKESGDLASPMASLHYERYQA
ncbi:MAG: acyl-CoA reductase, partial [Flavobacteriales bacterium]|nr:acyl-CoA reductase [Flavobacteriales bacterium]